LRCSKALAPEFKAYQQQVVANARAMASRCRSAATASCPAAPTTTCFLLDLIGRSYTGKDADAALGARTSR
jgi:glycine hydroxymethyltransferase